VRQLLVESVVLALGGGALGVALAVVGTRGLVLLAAARLPRVEGIGIDGHVLAFAVMISFAAGIVFGLVPALRLSSLDSHDVVKESRWSARPPGRGAARELLIVAECALTIVLLAGAGLLLRSLERLRSVNPGFDPRHVLIMRLYFPPETPTSAANGAENLDVARARFREQMLNDLAMRLAHVPRVDGLGFIDDMFITGRGNTSITIPAHAEATLNAELNDATVSPGLFEALHVPLRAGRLLTLDDALTKIRALWPPASSNDSLAAQERSVLVEPIVVNETFARRFFPNETPISKRFCIDCTRKPYWYEIVGVVGDMRRQGLERPPIPEYFGPLVPSSLGRADLVLRVEGDAMSAAPLVRQIVRTSMPNGLIAEVSTAEAELGQFSADRRFDAWLLSLFAALALALAAVGVYGVVHYSVAERTREIGIRIALGAGIDEVVRLVVRQGIRAPLVGVALGVIGALAVTRIMTRLLFGTTSADPATYLAVTLTLVVAAGFACYFPARRAATIDPMIALRRN
jgi:predicted permease